MRARVINGKWVLENPSGLPEGTEVEIVVRPVAREAAGVSDVSLVYLDDAIGRYAHALLVEACSSKYASSVRRPLGQKDEEDLIEGAKEIALGSNRRYTTPEDVKKAAARDVLCRFLASDDDIRAVLESTALP